MMFFLLETSLSFFLISAKNYLGNHIKIIFRNYLQKSAGINSDFSRNSPKYSAKNSRNFLRVAFRIFSRNFLMKYSLHPCPAIPSVIFPRISLEIHIPKKSFRYFHGIYQVLIQIFFRN